MILNNPITLPASKLYSTMTTLIGDIRFAETLVPSDLVNELVAGSRIGQVDFGKGIVYTFKLDTQPVKDLTESSSALTITKPNVAQETIVIDNYKFIPISTSEVLARDSALSGQVVNTFLNFVMSLMTDTQQFYMYDEVNKLIQEWEPSKASQTIEITQIDTTGMVGAELQATLQWNASEIARVMRKTINNMKIKNDKFTDLDTYEAQDGQEYKVVSALTGKDFRTIVNDKYWTNFLADAMSSLYHSEKIGEMIPTDNFNLLPEDAMNEDNTTTIAWLGDKKKFAFADYYRITRAFADPSTLYTNYFYHFAYGMGIFKYAPCVKFVAKVVQPAQA